MPPRVSPLPELASSRRMQNAEREQQSEHDREPRQTRQELLARQPPVGRVHGLHDRARRSRGRLG